MMKLKMIALMVVTLTACSGGNGSDALPRATIETSMGSFTVELRTDVAPISANNFIMHAEAGNFDDGAFYRVVRDDNEREGVDPIHIIQGGRTWDRMFEDEAYNIEHEPTSETGLSHTRGAISWARGDVDTASTEFFIMVNDQPSLDAGPDGRNPDGEGYAVFGEVVDGMEVVEAIWQSETGVPDGPEGFEQQWLTEPVIIQTVTISD